MKKGQNYNHPEPGQQIRVEPIKSLKDIETIKKLLYDKPRDAALFTIGINTALRASDLLSIKVNHVRGLRAMDEITLIEKKTKRFGKRRQVNLNKACIDAITRLLATRSYQDDDYLFTGQRGRLTVPYLHFLVKKWCSSINLQGNYGSHTLRKTFGFIQRTTFRCPLPELTELFGHATQRQTLLYLCIQPEEIKKIYANEI
jgi:integrase